MGYIQTGGSQVCRTLLKNLYVCNDLFHSSDDGGVYSLSLWLERYVPAKEKEREIQGAVINLGDQKARFPNVWERKWFQLLRWLVEGKNMRKHLSDWTMIKTSRWRGWEMSVTKTRGISFPKKCHHLFTVKLCGAFCFLCAPFLQNWPSF